MCTYSATKTLGDVDDHESTAAWVQKLKAIQDEKEKAERRVIIFECLIMCVHVCMYWPVFMCMHVHYHIYTWRVCAGGLVCVCVCVCVCPNLLFECLFVTKLIQHTQQAMQII